MGTAPVTAPRHGAVSSSGRLPALDGMRGLALLGMLGWHAQIDWIQGGFARMTIFFVLAGYLAASSQLRILDGGDARPFLTFWGRRARRLLPVTVLGVLAAVAATAAVGGSIAREQAAGDAASVLFSFSNWRFILQAREYGAMFEASSAFQHYWSLSVEEQCFVALPLVLAVTRGATTRLPAERRRAASVAVVLAVGAALALLPLVVTMSADAAYYSTAVRGGEFLAGAAFAIWWDRGRGRAATPRTVASWDVVGLAGLIVLLVVMTTMERETAWLYRGGMGLFAVPVVALLGGIVVGGRRVRWLLGIAPLATLGRWAFPIYVLHWPLFLVMDELVTGMDRSVLVALELAAAIALGGVVHRWFERPLMPTTGAGPRTRVSHALWDRPRRVVAAGAGALSVCLVAAVAVPATDPEIDFLAAEDELSAQLTPDQARELLALAGDATPDEPVPGGGGMTPDEVTRILGGDDVATPGLPVHRDPTRRGVAVFGGSTALAIALGGERLEQLAPDHQSIPGYSPLGCGVLDAGVRGDRSEPPDPEPPHPVPPECAERDLRWAATAVAHRVDVAVLAPSLMDQVEWQLPGDDQWRALGDPVFDSHLASELRSAIAALHAVGVAEVVLLTAVPPPERLSERRQVERRDRQRSYRLIVEQVATSTGAVVVDLGTWVTDLGASGFAELAPDGVHPNRAGAGRIWTDLLGPAVVALHTD